MKTAVCLYVRNESRDILEWILHHVSIGFDTVFVMDNNSDDDTKRIALSTARFHDVRTYCWTEIGSLSQINCYNHFLQNYSAEYDWVAFVDADEFIMPLADKNIRVFLAKFDNYGAVALNWAIFGSNGLQRAPNGFVMENYISRSDERFRSNRHVKSIIRPGFTISAINPYVFRLPDHPGSYYPFVSKGYADALGRPVRWSDQIGIIDHDPDFAVCRINHYYTRSRQHFDEKLRRKGWHKCQYPEQDFAYNDRNEVKDTSAFPFADAVHVLTNKFGQSGKFTPARYGSLPVVPFGSRFRDYVAPEPSEPIIFRDFEK